MTSSRYHWASVFFFKATALVSAFQAIITLENSVCRVLAKRFHRSFVSFDYRRASLYDFSSVELMIEWENELVLVKFPKYSFHLLYLILSKLTFEDIQQLRLLFLVEKKSGHPALVSLSYASPVLVHLIGTLVYPTVLLSRSIAQFAHFGWLYFHHFLVSMILIALYHLIFVSTI